MEADAACQVTCIQHFFSSLLKCSVLDVREHFIRWMWFFDQAILQTAATFAPTTPLELQPLFSCKPFASWNHHISHSLTLHLKVPLALLPYLKKRMEQINKNVPACQNVRLSLHAHGGPSLLPSGFCVLPTIVCLRDNLPPAPVHCHPLPPLSSTAHQSTLSLPFTHPSSCSSLP